MTKAEIDAAFQKLLRAEMPALRQAVGYLMDGRLGR